MISGLDGLSDELPVLITNSPFWFKKTPSILSRYCDSVNETVYGNSLLDAGVLETEPPGPVKVIYSV